MARKKDEPSTITDAHIEALEQQARDAKRDRDHALDSGWATAAASYSRLMLSIERELVAARRQQEAEREAALAQAAPESVVAELAEALRALPPELRASVLSAVEGRPRAVR